MTRAVQPKHAQVLPGLQLVDATGVHQESHRREVKGEETLEVLVIPANAQMVVSDDLTAGRLKSTPQQPQESALTCPIWPHNCYARVTIHLRKDHHIQLYTMHV